MDTETWEAQDWSFWAVQSIPQPFNVAHHFRADSTNYEQFVRDTVTGVITLILSAVYAHFWPASYCDVPKAKGMILSANIFTSGAVLSRIRTAGKSRWNARSGETRGNPGSRTGRPVCDDACCRDQATAITVTPTAS